MAGNSCWLKRIRDHKDCGVLYFLREGNMPKTSAKKAQEVSAKLELLVDTCVWLGIAEDHRQQPLLAALEELIKAGEISLIIPQVVKDEFARNKERIATESGRSLSSVIKRVKGAVDKFGEPKGRKAILAQLDDIDHRIITLGSTVNGSIERIEELLNAGVAVPNSDAVKLRAAERAIEKRAPFHRQRNGIDDAILIEIYSDSVATAKNGKSRFAFVTHNTKDFSEPAGDNRKPHPDIAALFGERSEYSISLGDVLKDTAPDLLEDAKFELEWVEEPHRLSEIVDAIDDLFDKVWYNRHLGLRVDVEEGRTKVVEKMDFTKKRHWEKQIQQDIPIAAIEFEGLIAKPDASRQLLEGLDVRDNTPVQSLHVLEARRVAQEHDGGHQGNAFADRRIPKVDRTGIDRLPSAMTEQLLK
jgi:hypothetical protein